jgi:hypothetical protein
MKPAEMRHIFKVNQIAQPGTLIECLACERTLQAGSVPNIMTGEMTGEFETGDILHCECGVFIEIGRAHDHSGS